MPRYSPVRGRTIDDSTLRLDPQSRADSTKRDQLHRPRGSFPNALRQRRSRLVAKSVRDRRPCGFRERDAAPDRSHDLAPERTSRTAFPVNPRSRSSRCGSLSSRSVFPGARSGGGRLRPVTDVALQIARPAGVDSPALPRLTARRHRRANGAQLGSVNSVQEGGPGPGHIAGDESPDCGCRELHPRRSRSRIRSSRRHSFVSMVESAHLGEHNHPAQLWPLDGPRRRGITIQR